MKQTFRLAALALLFAACHSNSDADRAQQIGQIEQLEQELAKIEVTVDNDKATSMVQLYEQYATNFPDDSLAPVYLMRAAEVMSNIDRCDDAIALYDEIINQYPGFEDIGGCLFMKGLTYEKAEQFDSARALYTRFIEQYPDHVLATDTRKNLPFVGLSAEEQLQRILENANDDNIALN